MLIVQPNDLYEIEVFFASSRQIRVLSCNLTKRYYGACHWTLPTPVSTTKLNTN